LEESVSDTTNYKGKAGRVAYLPAFLICGAAQHNVLFLIE
jgi:hypothetical protein